MKHLTGIVALAVCVVGACTNDVIELGDPCAPRLVGAGANEQDPLALAGAFPVDGGAPVESTAFYVGSIATPVYFEVIVRENVDDDIPARFGVANAEHTELLAMRSIDDAAELTVFGIAASPRDGAIAFRRQGVWLDGANPDVGVYPSSFPAADVVTAALAVGPGDILSLVVDRFRNFPPAGHARIVATPCPAQ